MLTIAIVKCCVKTLAPLNLIEMRGKAFIFVIIKDKETNLAKCFSQRSSKGLFFHTNHQLHSIRH